MAPTATRLEKLLIGEVSLVDAPANGLDGWLQKSAQRQTAYPVGPDRNWDAGAAEQRIRAATGATDEPTEEYASCFLAKSGGDADLGSFEDYRFLVCDVVDGAVSVMPAAVRAVAPRLEGSTLSEVEKAGVASFLVRLEKRVTPDDGISAADAHSIVGRIRKLLAPGKEDLEMTKDELTTLLDERDAALVEKVVNAVADSQAAPSTEGASEDGDASTDEVLDAEAVAKAVEAGIQPVLEILNHALDRLATVEGHLRVPTRKSLDGQESGTPGTEEATPTVGDAIAKALGIRAP